MSTRTLLPILFVALLAMHAPAESPRPQARKTRGKNHAQTLESYLSKVKAALSARWGAALTPRMADFTTGDLAVTFKLDAEGKVTEFAVTSNTSNEPFAKFCEQFVRETKFEKPPEPALKDGQLAIPFTFTIL